MEFRDVVVTPFSELMNTQPGGSEHRGGPAWPDWESQIEARHCEGGQPIDLEPEAAEPTAVVDAPVAWGGPITRHFGHQVVDFSMRLIGTADAWPEIPIVFATHPRERITAMTESPPFFRQMLEWLGVGNETSLIVQPTLARELRVVPQAEQRYGPGPSAAHLDRMDQLVRERISAPIVRTPVVYVSRARQHARFAAEGTLEAAFERSGAVVVRPETLPLADQLRTMVQADLIVFAEGSALHSANLLGRSLANVVVINRRPGTRLAIESIEPRARSVTYVDAVSTLIHGLRPSSAPAVEAGITVLDPAVLRAEMSAFMPAFAQHLPTREFADLQEEDVLAWMSEKRTLNIGRLPGSMDRILETLRASGLGHLTARAERVLRAPARPFG